MNTIWIVIPILTVLMFDLGLTLRLQDFGRVVKHPKAVIIALAGVLQTSSQNWRGAMWPCP